MTVNVTDNRNLSVPVTGTESGTWGNVLNSGVMDQLDLILGATQAISITIADVTLSIPQWNNVAINLTGALTGNRSLILPINANSSTVAVGGLFVVANNTTGSFTVTVKTAASGSTGVTVPQGVRTLLYSDTVNVWNADDAKFQMIERSGNPNGSVAGSAGTVNKAPTAVWDYTNGVLYFCTTTGTTSTAVWSAINVPQTSLPVPTPEGYLTPVSGTAIITSDSLSASIVYYTPFKGAWAAIHNGTAIIPYRFSQMQLTLTTSQAASNIYDVFLAYNGGTPVIGTGPSWTAGGGSVAAGSGSRGSGVGSTAISRASPSGLWVNTNAVSLIYNTGSGNNTISVPAGQGIFLGSLFIDAVAGQVTCHRSYGQARKWGISNAYNRSKIILTAGYGSNWSLSVAAGVWEAANSDATNRATAFNCLAEEECEANYFQTMSLGATNRYGYMGIGYNSTLSPSGFYGFPQTNLSFGQSYSLVANYSNTPTFGINNFQQLQYVVVAPITYNGGNAGMIMNLEWNA